MRPIASDPDYDPANFAQDYPHDEKLQEALQAARELSATIVPLLPNETRGEAQTRIDQEFAQLAIAIDKDLDRHHKSERSGFKFSFMQEREAEMRAASQRGIEGARLLEHQIGGQFALGDQIRSFRESIDNNEQLKTQMQQLVTFQAARSEAISHAIKYTPPHTPERENLSLTDEPPTPDPSPEPASLKRLKGESDHNYETRVALMNQTNANAAPDEPQIQPRHAANFRFKV